MELFILPALSMAPGGVLLLLSEGTWATKAQQLIVHSKKNISVFIKINFKISVVDIIIYENNSYAASCGCIKPATNQFV